MGKLGQVIRTLREQKKLTQGQLAIKAGVGRSTVTMIESGQREHITVDVLAKLAKALDTTPNDILERTGLKRPSPGSDPYFEALEAIWEMIPDWKKRDMVMQLRAYVEDHEQHVAEKENRQETSDSSEKKEAP
jgi:transcriptional regulator with XRE-family HTH domain